MTPVRRIIGQCNTADFNDLEHLAILVRRGGEMSPDNLNGRQKVAIIVLRHFQLCGIPFEVLLKLREVLVWEMPDKSLTFEFKLLNQHDVKTLDTLRTMRPTSLIKQERR